MESLEFGSLRGTRAVVTGGGSGIGEAVAIAIARHGGRVVLVGKTRDKLESVASRIRAADGEVDWFQADLSIPEETRRAVLAIGHWLDRVDMLINCAGVYREGPIADISDFDLKQLIDSNLLAPVLVIRDLVPRVSAGGCIVNVASMSAVRAFGDQQSVYAATKAALVHLGSCLARELAPRGIRVNTVSPGPTRTPILLTMLPPERVADVQKRISSEIPLGRMAEPGEIARAVLFCATQNLGTGMHIVLDGGVSL